MSRLVQLLKNDDAGYRVVFADRVTRGSLVIKPLVAWGHLEEVTEEGDHALTVESVVLPFVLHDSELVPAPTVPGFLGVADPTMSEGDVKEYYSDEAKTYDWNGLGLLQDEEEENLN